MPLEGLQLGNYRLLSLSGSGGMGEVYLAEDTRIRRQVAIKVVRAEASAYPDANATREAARLFQREMRAITALDHPHILPLFDFGEEGVNKATLTYMVMPYRTEGSLADWLQQRSSAEMLSPQDVTHFIEQAADALQHAHDHQLIHQDVKPSNFLIRNRAAHPNHPDLLLADFGIVKFTTATATASQSIRGTPAYMAPEQWDGQPVAATDQYALAVMAYQLLTGRPPFLGGPGQVMRQHFMAQPQPPSTLNPRISPALDAVILRGLEKKPEDRFASIADFAQAFQDALQGKEVAGIAKAKSLPSGADIRATLAISKAEALTGTSRTLTLPGGRRVSVSVPAGAYDGQVIRLEGQGEPSSSGGPAGSLILTIAIKQPEEDSAASGVGSAEKTARASNSNLRSSTTPAPSQSRPRRASSSPNSNLRDTATPVSRPTSGEGTTPRRSLSKGRRALLIGLALLVIATGLGAFYLIQANHNPYPPQGAMLALDDPLSDNSKGYNWNDDSTNCIFMGGAYHVSQQTGTQYCTAGATNFSNFTYEVQMTLIKGDCGGILFRANGVKLYFFEVCQDGTYTLSYTFLLNGSNPLAGSISSAINTRLNQPNVIAVVANGSTLNLYVNNQKIDSISDNTYSHGQIGVFAAAYHNPTEVVFSNAKVWAV